MLISTTSEIEGKNIKEYKGVVFGEVINRVNLFKDFKDFTANIANIAGGRVASYEEGIINTRADAINEMIERAEKVGANAVIGVKIDYETMGDSMSLLMVVASGTAVIIE